MLRPAGLFFQQAREGAPHYGHTLQNRDRTQAERRVHEALTPSAELAAVIGSEAVPRTEVTKKIWDYIKSTTCRMPATSATSTPTPSCAPSSAKTRSRCSNRTKLVNAHLK